MRAAADSIAAPRALRLDEPQRELVGGHLGLVRRFLAQTALAAPLNGRVDIAGPDRAPFAEIVTRYLKSVGDARPVVVDRDARYYGGRVEEQSLVPLGDARIGRVSLDQWLAQAKKG